MEKVNFIFWNLFLDIYIQDILVTLMQIIYLNKMNLCLNKQACYNSHNDGIRVFYFLKYISL